jgi:hypothetical protein
MTCKLGTELPRQMFAVSTAAVLSTTMGCCGRSLAACLSACALLPAQPPTQAHAIAAPHFLKQTPCTHAESVKPHLILCRHMLGVPGLCTHTILHPVTECMCTKGSNHLVENRSLRARAHWHPHSRITVAVAFWCMRQHSQLSQHLRGCRHSPLHMLHLVCSRA